MQAVSYSGDLDIPPGCVAAIDVQIELQQIPPPREGVDREAQGGRSLSPDIVTSPVEIARRHAKGPDLSVEKAPDGRQPLCAIDDLHPVGQIARAFTIPVRAVESEQAFFVAQRAAQEPLYKYDLLCLGPVVVALLPWCQIKVPTSRKPLQYKLEVTEVGVDAVARCGESIVQPGVAGR